MTAEKTAPSAISPKTLALCLPVLLLVLCAPYLLNMGLRGGLVGTAMPDPEVRSDADVYDGVWHFWWVKRALTEPTDPRFSELLDHPRGASVVFQNVGWPDCTLMLPLTAISPVLAYNADLILGTLLTALMVGLLAREWGVGVSGAVIAGLVAAWLPSRTAHVVQHYQLANLGWLAGSMLFARRAVRRGDAGDTALAGLFILLSLMQSPYFAPLCALGVLVAVVSVRGRPLRWRRIISVAAIWMGAALLAGLFYLTGGRSGAELEMGWREAVYWSAEPQSFVLPSPFGLLGRSLGLPLRLSWMPNLFEGVVTPGLSVLVLGILGWKKRSVLPLLGALLCFLLALGPELRLMGRSTGIPMPYRLLQMVPLLGGARAPSRFAMLGGLLLAISVGLFFQRLSRKARVGVLAAIVVELSVFSLPSLSARVPSVYEELEPSIGPVLEIPCSPSIRRYAYFQTVDGNPRYISYMARPVRQNVPEVLRPFALGCDSVPDVSDLRRTGASVVIYNRWLFEPNRREKLDARFASIFDSAPPGDSVWIERTI
ncbi:hypothetical protein GF402_05940 [Candidatus Fermentibacteria bacterium]|nr:hypothetical protein [Candidatus Fermentibacteria bacterium]